MKKRFRLTKKIICALVVMALIFSFSAVALAEGDNGGPGPGPSSTEERSEETRKEMMKDFALAIKAEIAELRQLRNQIREPHQANIQLRQQIKERIQELKDTGQLDLDEEKLERLRNATRALRKEAQQNRTLIKDFREDMAGWRENRDILNIPKALKSLNALQARYRTMLEHQNRLTDALSVVLAHLESI